MRYFVKYIIMWESKTITFESSHSRKCLSTYLDDSEKYIQAVEDLDDVINLDEILENKEIATKIYINMRPSLQNGFKRFFNKKL